MSTQLQHKRVAILAADGFEQSQLEKPMNALKEAGATVSIVSPKRDKIQGMNHAEKGDTFDVDIRERLLSFAMVFALGFLVLVSLVLSAGIAALGSYMKGWAPGSDALWESANSLVSLVVVTLLFAALFRFLPDVKVAWRDVWTGAAMTAALFVLGKFLLGFYIGRSAFASAYGAAGS